MNQDKIRDSGLREVDLRETCNLCKGKGGFPNHILRCLDECDTCKGEGRLPFNMSEKQIEHQKLWSK